MKVLAFFLAIALVFVIWEHNTANHTPTADTMNVKLYYYNPVLDQGQGGIQCSDKGLVAVERAMPRTEDPIQETIKLLIKGELTFDEKSRGIETDFPLAGVTLKSATMDTNGDLTLEFTDPYNNTSGGSCRVSVLRAEVEKTAEQFPDVKKVILAPADIFQP